VELSSVRLVPDTLVRPQRHARLRAQSIIGVPACVPIPAKSTDRTPEGKSCLQSYWQIFEP
jgi:hypothetical protein